MSKDFVQLANDVIAGSGKLRDAVPETMKAFVALSKAATVPGALNAKTKELMAVAIGIAIQCDSCIAFHMKMALRQGATREEVVETAALAIYMGGGPASVYAANALRAYEQLAEPPTKP